MTTVPAGCVGCFACRLCWLLAVVGYRLLLAALPADCCGLLCLPVHVGCWLAGQLLLWDFCLLLLG